MLEIKGVFSKNELAFINVLNESLSNRYSVEGTIKNRGEFVRYEVYIENPIDNDLLVLQFGVRDNENTESGGCNFVYISNIVVPNKYQGQGIATGIIILMCIVAKKKVGIEFFITGIVNDLWKESLMRMGGIEDDDGDIQIIYENCIEGWYATYGRRENDINKP